MGRKKPKQKIEEPRPFKSKAIWILPVLIIAAIAGFFATRKHAPKPVEITGPVTYSKHIAPILFDNCATCHRPNGSAPFELLSYDDARKRAKDIARVTAKRLMPPWQPEHGYGEFENERRLTDLQIATIAKWVEQQTPEGNLAEAPPAPQFNNEWQLGQPDLIVQPSPYTLPADGKDIYYNFVVPIPISANKYVAAVELLSGNPAVHHAFINVDETRAARRLGAKNNPPGFLGMDTPESTSMPGGQLLGWQPGKIPTLNPPGLAWILRTNTDLVLQAHMNPTGKPESVAPKLGFYFTDQPPTNTSFRIRLTSLQLDIPAGESNYVTEQTYTLPVDVNLVRVGAHAHYLAKDMQGYAILPSGEKKRLLWIKDWDFKWQGDYKYKQPVFIPKGSKLALRFTYDNSTNNIRNPFNPPRRTVWGLNTTDEMGELYFQALPPNRDDYKTLASDYSRDFLRVSMDFYRHRLALNPNDAEFHQRLGRACAAIGKLDEGATHLHEAIRLDPKNDLAHFDLGSIYLRKNMANEAYREFLTTTQLNPEDGQAFGSLGIICAQTGRLDEARQHFNAALRINPEDALALRYIQKLNSSVR
ncbi:MAG TPA: tetratricopeptide repeat protein [Verrucomicrobiae bacterium]|nr:tetratricopeptide repeat protein [Verrucomicrobiae bacterium]